MDTKQKYLDQIDRFNELRMQGDKHSIRYQLINGTIERDTYIEPVSNWLSVSYNDEEITGDMLVTDDPHYLTMGWLAELGIANIIKLTNEQIDTLYAYMFDTMHGRWERRVLNNKRGYKVGAIATVEFPSIGRNYDLKHLSIPVLVNADSSYATIEFNKYYTTGSIAKHSRIRKRIYRTATLVISRQGTIVEHNVRYYHLDINKNRVYLEDGYKPQVY